MDFAKIRAEYARLCADAEMISFVSDNLPVSSIELYDEMERLEASNQTAQKSLIEFAVSKFPSVLSDVLKMPEQAFLNWILLLQEYPQFLVGQEGKFASLFWNLCNSSSREERVYFSEMIKIATGYTMLHWVLTSEKKDVVEPYLAEIQKHLSKLQLKQFQYKMERIKKGKKGEGK